MATDRVISVTGRAILTCWLTAKSFPFQARSEFSDKRHASHANHAAAWPFVHPPRGSTIDHFHELDSVTEGIGRAPLPNLTSFYNLVRFFSFECN